MTRSRTGCWSRSLFDFGTLSHQSSSAWSNIHERHRQPNDILRIHREDAWLRRLRTDQLQRRFRGGKAGWHCIDVQTHDSGDGHRCVLQFTTASSRGDRLRRMRTARRTATGGTWRVQSLRRHGRLEQEGDALPPVLSRRRGKPTDAERIQVDPGQRRPGHLGGHDDSLRQCVLRVDRTRSRSVGANSRDWHVAHPAARFCSTTHNVSSRRSFISGPHRGVREVRKSVSRQPMGGLRFLPFAIGRSVSAGDSAIHHRGSSGRGDHHTFCSNGRQARLEPAAFSARA